MSQPAMAPVQPQQNRSVLWSWLSLDNPYLPPVFITLILLVGHFSFGILESYRKTLLAIVCSMACELVLSRILVGRWPNLASSYITGISVGILLRSPGYW